MGKTSGPSTNPATPSSALAPATSGSPTKDSYSSVARPDQTEQHSERRRFSRAVRTEEAVDVACLDSQVDTVDSDDLPEPLDEAAHLDWRCEVAAQETSARAAASASACVTDPGSTAQPGECQWMPFIDLDARPTSTVLRKARRVVQKYGVLQSG